MVDIAASDVCQCEKPVCRDCQLPIRIGAQDVTQDVGALIAKIKEQLKSPDFMEFPRDKFERALFFTVDTFKYLKATKEALERKDPITSLLSGVFFDIEEDPKPLLYLVQILNLPTETPDLSRRIQRYVTLLQDLSEKDENMMKSVECSSPEKCRHGKPVYPPLKFISGHVLGDFVTTGATNT